MQEILYQYPGLDIKAGSVFDLVLDQSTAQLGRWAKVIGVRLGVFTPNVPPTPFET